MEKPSKYSSNNMRIIIEQTFFSVLSLKKKSLQKYKCWMSRRSFKRVTFRLKLLRQMRISLQKEFVFFNKSLENGKFPNCLKLANITPIFKKTIDQLVFSLFFQKYLKGQLAETFQSSLIIYYLIFNLVLEKVIELNIAYY